MTHAHVPTASEKLAIIGIGCRLPGGASDHRTFWQNLVDGKDCIVPTPADRYDVTTLGSATPGTPGRLVGGRGGYIDGFDEFDPAFFGISPREAHHMDPQQRKLLEVAWEALEDGGQKPGELAGQDIGVFVGAFTLDYKILQFADLGFETLAAHTATGTMMTMASNRISYCFDFRGPSVSLDTACSSSLVALDLACRSLRRGETSLALAGGTLLHMAPQYTIAETQGGFLSPDGRSRTFDASANGYVRAEGVGLVALKRLDDALRDGDPIHAVVIGSGVNQDGRTNGITVPNPQAQTTLIQRVCAEAGIAPGSLQYVEAHGTSTPVGDPIEANALGRALAIGRPPGAKCYVGSVKTNIGHTESAAGIAGLIKTVLSLKHRTIPPHINLTALNPGIDLESLPYEIPTRVTKWPDHEGPARAGVNSFGFGGTNAHVLLEEAPHRPHTPEPPTAKTAPAWTVLPLSARDPDALPEVAAGIQAELSGAHGEPVRLSDLGHTLAHRRQHLESRLSVVYSARSSLEEALEAYRRGEAHPHVLSDQVRDAQQRRLVWVFTGMGPQWWAMGRQLFADEPVYRAAVERCDREISALTGWSLIEEMAADEPDSRMGDTWLAQPANFALQVGLAALWRSRGVRPDAVVGHSTGEIAAFYEAGVYTLADAARIVVHRSRLQQKLAGTGTMLAAGLTEDEALRRIRPYGDRVSLAAVNSPGAVTLAGDRDALGALAAELAAEQVFARFLTVEVPYHSARMELIKDDLLASLADLAPRVARLPLYLTGREGLARGEELDAGYWWDNVRDSVRFHAAVDRLADDGYDLFLEIGPHPVLSRAIQECLNARGTEGTTLPSIRRQEEEAACFTTSLAALHNLGCAVDWTVLQPAGRPVPLPRYPWKRDRYWTEPPPVAQVRLGRLDHPLLGRRLACAEPTWETRLDTGRMPYLADHRIQDNVLFPAAGYLEMAVQAVRALTGAESAVLADVELRKGLFLTAGDPTTVQLTCSLEDASFTVATVPDTKKQHGSSSAGTVHASGTVRTGQRPRPLPVLTAETVRDRTERHLTGTDCYAELAELGYHYGPAFQAIEEVWIGHGEALARVRATEAVGDDAVRHHFHPVLLDACFQSLLTPQLLDTRTGPGGPGIRLPLSIDEVRVDPVGDQELWVHATVARNDGDVLVGDITVYGDDGAPLGRISGFRAADAEKAATTAGLATIDTWLAEPAWREAPAGTADRAGEEPDTRTETSGPPAGQGLLLFADEQGVADAMAALVTAQGGRVHLVRHGDRYADGRGETTVVPDSAADLRRLFDELTTGSGTPDGAEPVPFDTVVHLWNLDQPALEETDRDHIGEHNSLGSYSLIALAQTLPSALPGSRLHIVTRGSQAVRPGDPVEPLGAPAWGIGRVLRYQELTGQRGKLIDLDPAAATDAAGRRSEAEALLRECVTDDEDEIALRGTSRRTCRLVPPADLTRPLPLRLRADGSYLVTGAFGALGRLLCRTLVKRGARRLILVGRTRLPERSAWRELDPDSAAGDSVRFVKELEALGAQPIPAPLDITDEAALTAWLAEYRRQEGPPVRGVFHLAGQVRDTLVPEMDRQVFDTVHDPKVVGAFLLDRLLREEPLEHFVLFASVASLLTTAGQTNYAAGNAFLDALAHHRRARGLPALSLDWGPWATGMIEELGLIDHYRNSRGMTSLSPDAGMAVLERVIGQEPAQLVVATVTDWPVFQSWYPSPQPLVSELAEAAAGASAGEHHTFLDTYRAAGEERRRELVAQRFTALTAGVLRVSEEQVDPALGPTALGLDSLLAMELRARLSTELGATLPVVALLSNATFGELTERLDAGVAEQVAAEQDGGSAQADVEVYHDEGRYPLTQNQKALWFLKQLNPDGFAYNIGGAVEVRVPLDPELMFDAVRVLLTRHPSLRANFVVEQGRPVQVISPEPKEDLGFFDVQDLDWDDIHQMIVREYRAPYDLERDPLLRFRLFKRADDRWVIMKAVHHIVSDAISTFTFIEELLAVYEGLRRGNRPELPPLTSRYLDFLNRQNEFLAGPEADRMLDYWKSHLPDEVPTLNLPTDKPRPAVQTNNGASEFLVLDAELSARVHTLAREHNVTAFMVLLAAYYALLHRYTGQDDIIVGSPVTGRTQEEFNQVYGYFVNPLPLYADLAGEPTVAELLDQVRGTVLGGLDHQEYPFVLLVEKLGLQHDPSRSAVFQAMFILLTHKVATEKYGYRLEYIDLPEEEGQFDLTLSAYEDEAEGRFHCAFKYNTDLFVPATMRRLTTHYRNLLEALTRAPADQPVSRLTMLGEQERAHILTRWSGAGSKLAPHTPVHHLISKVADERPEAVAVSAPSESGSVRRLTYAQLHRRSDALARGLRDRGVRNGSVVGVCARKSPELIEALLAVLKAGGAYLPLDPEYPADRLTFMAHHADAALVVADHAGQERLAGAAVDVVPVETLAADTGPVSDAAPDDGGGPSVPMDAPAYVMYTSGSTGKPKAVRVSHRSLAAVLSAWQQEYRLDSDVRVHLQMAGASFDVFTGDLVRALCSGGTLVLADRDLLFNTARLYDTMVRERVDCAEFVPAVLRGLMDHCEHNDRRLDFMRLLITGSDAWKVAEYQRLRTLCGPLTRLVNSYGLTEATIDSSWFDGPTEHLDPSRMVPIGRPFPNTALYILDAHREPVPPGVTGELWVGGDGLTAGYLGDPDLTAERFCTLPLLGAGAEAAPVRLYRTGDLAHWDADGVLHLVGRADNQVKVRGHRIEIGEVESQLALVPGLDRAVVTVRPDVGGEAVLCAYCVPEAGTTVDRRELRRQLANRLPTFMIPSYFEELPRLPLTPNGKVDVGALPAPRPEPDQSSYQPPVTLFERSMAAHWSSLLGLEQAGLEHDFFEAGGSSIKLIELIHGLQSEFGITIPVSRLFQVTTLQGMSKTVEDIITGRIDGAEPYLTFGKDRGAVAADGTERPYLFGFPPAGGHGLVYREFATHLPEFTFVAFNHMAGDDKVARYADLIESLQEGPYLLFGYSLGGNLAFEVAKELERRGREVEHVVIMDSYRIDASFDLAEEHLDAFERELQDHLRKHTGSETVAEETLEQAREYIRFCSRTPNTGVVSAHVSVISDVAKTALYASGQPGSWHSSTAGEAVALRGHGTHAEMLDQEFIARNARLTRALLTGEESRAA
ncbi:non-ribosomal peptide synthetase/type I polyketide synthase [Streptomyces olivaceiscleroticus]